MKFFEFICILYLILYVTKTFIISAGKGFIPVKQVILIKKTKSKLILKQNFFDFVIKHSYEVLTLDNLTENLFDFF